MRAARPIPVQQLLLRAGVAERATTDAVLATLLGTLVDRITQVLDRLSDPSLPVYVDAFQALASAVDLAEVLSRRPEPRGWGRGWGRSARKARRSRRPVTSRLG